MTMLEAEKMRYEVVCTDKTGGQAVIFYTHSKTRAAAVARHMSKHKDINQCVVRDTKEHRRALVLTDSQLNAMHTTARRAALELEQQATQDTGRYSLEAYRTAGALWAVCQQIEAVKS